MKSFRTKRIYETPSGDDGYRIFVDRLWPRGLNKNEVSYDLWAKDIAPSPDLRKWYHADIDGRWEEFAARYERELADADAAETLRGYIAGQKVVTLLYAAKDSEHSHALVLADYLRNNF